MGTNGQLDVPISEGRTIFDGHMSRTVTQQQGKLTKRQLEILTLYANGFRTAEIMERLFLSRRTVNWHAEWLKYRLGANTVAHAVKLAIGMGLIDPETTIPLPLKYIRGKMTRVCYLAREIAE
jgi:DNA-binding CsgD family transcriptional regulator